MRNALYAKLQDLPVSFHDRWPSGQLLSRAISDLNLIRRWISFGIVLLDRQHPDDRRRLRLPGRIDWILGVIFVVCSIPLWIYGYVFESKYSTVARRSQDQAGDLATAVEESVHGIRVLKAFGRGPHQLDRFSRQAEELRGTEIEKAQAIAGIWFWLLLVPDVTFAICLLVGRLAGRDRPDHRRASWSRSSRRRPCCAFPVESIGFLLSMTYDTRTAVDRFFEVIDSPNPIQDPEHPKTIAQPEGRLEFQQRALPVRGLARAVPRPDRRARPHPGAGRDHGAGGSDRVRKVDRDRAHHAALRRDRRIDHRSTASTSAT